MSTRAYTDLALYRRLLSRARPYWLHAVGIFVLSLLAIPIPLLTPLPMKIVVDALSGGPPVPAFLEPLLPESITGSATALFAFAAGLFVVLGIVQQVLKE